MNLLLDTHVVIWLIQGNENISQTARNLKILIDNLDILPVLSLNK